MVFFHRPLETPDLWIIVFFCCFFRCSLSENASNTVTSAQTPENAYKTSAQMSEMVQKTSGNHCKSLQKRTLRNTRSVFFWLVMFNSPNFECFLHFPEDPLRLNEYVDVKYLDSSTGVFYEAKNHQKTTVGYRKQVKHISMKFKVFQEARHRK